MQRLTVAQDGSGDYTSIQSAINAVRVHPLEPATIYIKNGTYRERVTIPDNKPDLTLVGESAEHTIITYDLFAQQLDAEGVQLGTFRTATLTVAADDFAMENVTVVNSAGYGKDIGQALALYVSGDRQSFRGVRLLANQDTFYTARGRQYFDRCYIEGHVDYIFGSGTVVFDHCEIHTLRNGYITAASTPKHTAYGFVFLDCQLGGPAEVDTVFLGRPWRPHAHTVFIRSWISHHIKPEGWDNWRDPNNESTVRYMEYGSYGPGADKASRVSWARTLSSDEAEEYTVERVLSGADGWNPQS
jgi:pectinesterase